MGDEMVQCAEEIFFERYFEVGNDKETALANFDAALKVYFRASKECEKLAEKIEDGEVVDDITSMLSLQSMIFAYKYATQFMNELGEKGTIIDIFSIDVSNKTPEQLAKDGSVLISAAKANMNLSDLVLGKYYLFAAMKN